MKILSTEGLTKLIQLIKSNFIGINNTVTTNTVTLATVATSGSYNDLLNKPTIPTVGDGTLTITQDGTTLGTVTMNQSTNSTIDIPPAATRNIGEIVTSTIPLTDAGLHLLDGALISGSGIYSDFVDYIAGLVTDYPDLFETEANWQSAVTTYGVCGKFVYNSTNNTVRLPKITGILEGTTDVTALGDLVEAGLPNITGTTNWIPRGHRDDTPTGAFTQEKSSSEWYGNRYDGSDYFTKYSFDASLSSSIYGNSTTVQPQTIKVLYYIVIATSTKTEIQVDIDEIATDINGKADVDLSNVPTSKGILTESYVNGTSWYRVYSDGWCEQGGSLGSSSYVDINLLKPFKDTNYTITACGGLSLYINTKTTSIIQIDNNYGTSTKYPLDWQACGYIR